MGGHRESMSRQRKRSTPSLLRQLGEREIVLPIGGGLAVSWLELQAVFLFACCVMCACCSISAYAWGCVRLDQLWPAPTYSPLATETVAPTPAGEAPGTEPPAEMPTGTPAGTPTGTPTPSTPSPPPPPTRPLEGTLPGAPPPTATPLPPPTATPPPAFPSPTPVLPRATPEPTPAPTDTPQPTETATPTELPTSTPTPTRTPTPTPTPLPSDVRIAFVQYNPPGDALADEYVVVENRGSGSQDVSGWTLSDDQWNTYFFPTGFVLRGGASVTVWTQSGTDSDTDLFWGRSGPVWGNQSDTAYLRDNTGTVVDSLSW